jgi:energy-converting hydrogenase Eha subunit F
MTATAAPRSAPRSWKIHIGLPLPKGAEAPSQISLARPSKTKRVYPFYEPEFGVLHAHLVKWSKVVSKNVLTNRVAVALNKCSERTGRVFTSRSGTKGILVWRVA